MFNFSRYRRLAGTVQLCLGLSARGCPVLRDCNGVREILRNPFPKFAWTFYSIVIEFVIKS